MRRFVVKKRFSDFLALQSLLVKEINIFPNLLVKDVLHKLFLGDINHRGQSLATYLNDIHNIFANHGCYSPRLMHFLNIDVLKVNIMSCFFLLHVYFFFSVRSMSPIHILLCVFSLSLSLIHGFFSYVFSFALLCSL